MSTGLIIVLVIVGILYLGSGYFGAVMLTKIWKSNQAVKEEEMNELDYDEDGGVLIKPEKSDPALLTICQCLCILFGPTVPCLVIFGLFLVYITLSIISVIAWCVKRIKERENK